MRTPAWDVEPTLARPVTVEITPAPEEGPTASRVRGASPPDAASEASLITWCDERLPGTPYLVRRRIGHGGMGEIYEAEHADLGRQVALKVLHRQHLGRADLAARLRDEARLMARLRHPNLVEVFDLGVTSDGRPWFAMPLLRGQDLRELLARRGPLPPALAADLAAQALDGLAVAHAAGLVHRDVKLENLFLEEGGTVKVLDFGVAKIVHAGGPTVPGASPGTPRTMAPEQCGGGAVDARADLYAVGLALYELCTGRGPFDDVRGQDHALRFAHCRRSPPPPSAVCSGPLPAWVDLVIARAIAKDPRDRFQTAHEMAAALRAHGAARGASPSPPPSVRGRRGGRRRRWAPSPSIAASLSALAIACFALGLAFGRTLPGAAAPPAPPEWSPRSPPGAACGGYRGDAPPGAPRYRM